jgi:hypothetical protein
MTIHVGLAHVSGLSQGAIPKMSSRIYLPEALWHITSHQLVERLHVFLGAERPGFNGQLTSFPIQVPRAPRIRWGITHHLPQLRSGNLRIFFRSRGAAGKGGGRVTQ